MQQLLLSPPPPTSKNIGSSLHLLLFFRGLEPALLLLHILQLLGYPDVPLNQLVLLDVGGVVLLDWGSDRRKALAHTPAPTGPLRRQRGLLKTNTPETFLNRGG